MYIDNFLSNLVGLSIFFSTRQMKTKLFKKRTDYESRDLMQKSDQLKLQLLLRVFYPIFYFPFEYHSLQNHLRFNYPENYSSVHARFTNHDNYNQSHISTIFLSINPNSFSELGLDHEYS